MKYAMGILIVCMQIAICLRFVSGSVCSWKALHCDRDEVLCDEKESVLLDAKNPQNTEHCFAIRGTTLGKFRNYDIEVDMLSLESNEGQNSGHLGIVFNYQDQLNYDFVYLEIHDLAEPPKSSNRSDFAALISGYRLNGEYFLDDRIPVNTNVPGNIFHSFRVVVDKTSIQSTKVFLDGKFIGAFKEHFVPRMKGGVFVVNKVGSVGLFQNFNLKGCKKYDENGLCLDEGDWRLAANINPCDGNNFGYGGPWSKGSNVGTFSQAFLADYLNNSIWRDPLNYITITRHNNGQCTMSKTWKLLGKSSSLFQYFSTYPGRLYVTGDGSVNDNHIHSDIPMAANGLSGTWKDPIFGADGGLVFNWGYGDNGVRIGVPGGRYLPYVLPAIGDNTDDFHGLGNDFHMNLDGVPLSGSWWHDVGKIGPKCFGSSCKPIGTDHGPSLTDGECWGSYAIYVSEDAKSFQCQGRTLEANMAPRTM